ncbi:MAG: SDR family NAD(P)-dependent oxidoreductase [Gammaproteobacteria bacterium]
MKLKNKVAIVTGGARDIGGAISKSLAAEGAKVVINYFNNQSVADQTLQEITDAGGTATLIRADMTNQEGVDAVLSHAQATYGDSIDVLVNVTGGMVARKSLAEMDEEFFEKVMRLNLTTTFLATKAVVPHMGSGSAIVNLASLAGRDGGGPGAAAYSTSKGAVITFTRAMAKELGPSGIRCNSVCPGMISTTFHDEFTKDAVRANVAGATPLRREGKAEEVADFVTYLASDDSSFITGGNYDINGGLFFS